LLVIRVNGCRARPDAEAARRGPTSPNVGEPGKNPMKTETGTETGKSLPVTATLATP